MFTVKIVYRVISAVLAACVIPAALFAPIVRIVGGISLSKGNLLAYSLSIKQIYTFLSGRTSYENFGFGSVWENEAFIKLKPALFTLCGFIILSVIIALVTFFFAALTNMRKTVCCLSVGGMLSVVGMFISFKALAAPLIDQTITLGSFFSSMIMSILIDALGEITDFQAGGAFWLMLFAFGAVFVWSISNILIEVGETKR